MQFLLELAIMLIAAKLLADVFELFKLPELFGAMLAGILFGPVLGLVQPETIAHFGEVGLVLLLFRTGFEEVDLKTLLKYKSSSMLVGFLGSFIPFFIIYVLSLSYFGVIEALFIACAMTATSISIPLGPLSAAKKLNSKAGSIIVGSAIIDDIISILFIVAVLGAVSGATAFSSFISIATGVIIFGGVILLSEYLLPKILRKINILIVEEAQFSITLALILLLAAIASALGLSVVLGAFVAGVLLAKTPLLKSKFVSQFSAVSEGVFIPLFYAWVGLQIIVDGTMVSWFAVILVIFAFLTKLIPSMIGALLMKTSTKEGLIIGLGMVPRGEVALVVIALALETGLLTQAAIGPIMLVILVTTFLPLIALQKLLQ